MSLRASTKLGLQLLQNTTITPIATAAVNLQFVRYRRTKHWNPKWKLFRRLKVIKVDLPNFNENVEDLSEDEIRNKMKEKGILPPRPWSEKPVFISSTGSVFEAYVPPEGDGKVSSITAQGAKQKLEFLSKKTKSMMAVRKIRTYEDEFDLPDFCKIAEDVYIKSHECMVSKDKDKLIEYVTERAYPEVMHNIMDKTIRWKMIESIELPRVVHARYTDIVTKQNIFAQLTVRFHTKQMLAVYDRFGRLMHGSEIIAKDVLEYVVFEKHLANLYGKWRIHDKIIPDWLPPREPTLVTYKAKKDNIETTEVKAPVVESADKPVTVEASPVAS